jgi:hypothetical protein
MALRRFNVAVNYPTPPLEQSGAIRSELIPTTNSNTRGRPAGGARWKTGRHPGHSTGTGCRALNGFVSRQSRAGRRGQWDARAA